MKTKDLTPDTFHFPLACPPYFLSAVFMADWRDRYNREGFPKIHRLKKDMDIWFIRRSIFSKISEKAPDITVTL